MSWVNTTVQEGLFLEGIAEILEPEGWELLKKYNKIVCPKEFFIIEKIELTLPANTTTLEIPLGLKNAPEGIIRGFLLFEKETGLIEEYSSGINNIYIESKVYDRAYVLFYNNVNLSSVMNFNISSHYIFKNQDGLTFGLALYLETTKTIIEILEKSLLPFITPKDNLEDENTKIIADNVFSSWLIDSSKQYFERSTLYSYMIESLQEEIINKEEELFPWEDNDTAKNYSLDQETISYFEYNPLEDEYELKVDNFPETMQSPIVPINIRRHSLDNVYKDNDLGIDIYDTNWWEDSDIKVKGQLDYRTIFLIIEADNTSAFEGNVVSTVPFYFGEIDLEETEERTIVLITGTTPNETNYNFDDSSNEPIETILPLSKTYESNPANAINNVMVMKNKNGSYYKSHYLSWNTISNLVSPDRIGNNKYPRSWGQNSEDEFLYQFNPSGYSEEGMSSEISVISPEEGVRGNLRLCVAINPLSLIDEDKLKATSEFCPNKYDYYIFKEISGISPFTSRPSTVYRPMGIGIFEKTE